jgi:hypothetical protein
MRKMADWLLTVILSPCSGVTTSGVLSGAPLSERRQVSWGRGTRSCAMSCRTVISHPACLFFCTHSTCAASTIVYFRVSARDIEKASVGFQRLMVESLI